MKNAYVMVFSSMIIENENMILHSALFLIINFNECYCR